MWVSCLPVFLVLVREANLAEKARVFPEEQKEALGNVRLAFWCSNEQMASWRGREGGRYA